jgi:hypothetical protein
MPSMLLKPTTLSTIQKLSLGYGVKKISMLFFTTTRIYDLDNEREELMISEMSEYEIEIQQKKIDQLQKIINRLEVMTVLICILQCLEIMAILALLK